jgi:hypothetical protein
MVFKTEDFSIENVTYLLQLEDKFKKFPGERDNLKNLISYYAVVLIRN